LWDITLTNVLRLHFLLSGLVPALTGLAHGSTLCPNQNPLTVKTRKVPLSKVLWMFLEKMLVYVDQSPHHEPTNMTTIGLFSGRTTMVGNMHAKSYLRVIVRTTGHALIPFGCPMRPEMLFQLFVIDESGVAAQTFLWLVLWMNYSYVGLKVIAVGFATQTTVSEGVKAMSRPMFDKLSVVLDRRIAEHAYKFGRDKVNGAFIFVRCQWE
jgi:hypothetical protein